MSKSRGNVVNPDDVVRDYGADTLRLYEMFIGDFEKGRSLVDLFHKGLPPLCGKGLESPRQGEREEGRSKALEKALNRTIKR